MTTETDTELSTATAVDIEPAQEPLRYPPYAPVSIATLGEIADRSVRALEAVRSEMLKPDSRKRPPQFNASQVCRMAGITQKSMIDRLAKLAVQLPDPKTGKKELPEGVVIHRSRREFTLADGIDWIRHSRAKSLRPKGAKMVTIPVAFFKGGSTKTTTAVCVAQALTLLGHKVLIIDLDPQGTATNLFGVYPETEVSEEQTLNDLFAGRKKTLVDVIQKTYWDSLDLIPAGPPLFAADLYLSALSARGTLNRFWEVLSDALVEVEDQYDVCIIDTPPSLSPITVNALMAGQGMIVPMPPSNLDFASSASFFSMLAEMTETLPADSKHPPKSFDFVHVLLSKVNANDSATDSVRELIKSTFQERVLAAEVPLTTVATVAAVGFSTLYDLSSYSGSARTYARAREAFDRVALLIEHSIQQVWKRQLAEQSSASAKARAAA